MVRVAWILGVVFVLGAVSCGGGGGDGGGGDDPAPRLIEVFFPTAHCLAGEGTLTVRGGATDPARVMAVEVSGVAATTTDGFANWVAEVPLDPGDNTLRVTVVDDEGGVHGDQAVLNVMNRGFFPLDVRDVALDVAHGLVYGVDARLQTVFSLDLSTGYRAIVSGPHRGTGPVLVDPEGIAVDPANLRAWVTDGLQGSRTVIEIDLPTGNRTVLSGGGTGGGTTLSSPMGIIRDAQNDRLLVVEQNLGKQAVVAIDLSNGNRSPVSNATTGAGTMFSSPVDLALDGMAGRLYVLDDSLDMVFGVSLTTGNRSIVSSDVMGTGPELDQPTAITYDPVSLRVHVMDRLGQDVQILEVDPTTGNRTAISSEAVGTGPEFGIPGGLVHTADGVSLIACDRTHQVLRVNRSSGNRTDIASDGVGSGESIRDRYMSGVAPHSDGRQVFITSDGNPASVIRLDLATGVRSLISGDGVGSGVDADGLRRPVLHEGDTRLAASWSAVIYRIELGSGARSVLASGTVGSGPAISNASGMAYDAVEDAICTVDPNLDYLGRVDPATGDRVTVSSGAVGAGPTWSVPDLLALDAPRGLAYVLDSGGPRTVFETSLTNGDRSVLASNTVGSGGFLPGSAGLVFDPARRRLLLVTDYHHAPSVEILEIDAVTGDHDRRAGFGDADGPWPRRPMHVSFDAVRNRLYVTDWQLRCVILIDVPPDGGMPGDRVMVAR